MPDKNDNHDDRLRTTAEIAAIFRVAAKTVRKWAVSGIVRAIATPAGYRFRLSELEEDLRLRDGRRSR